MKIGKCVGSGNTANIYEWDSDKIIKLFHEGYPEQSIRKEYNNAKKIEKKHLSMARAYELIYYNHRLGIIYDKIDGESLIEWLFRTEDYQGCASYMSALHKTILTHKAVGVPSYKVLLAEQISNRDNLPIQDKLYALHLLEHLPNGNVLCHGDFHPGNILLKNGKAVLIDYQDVCTGDEKYDIAQTLYLLEESNLPSEIVLDEINLAQLQELRHNLAEIYLSNMGLQREELLNYLEVIRAAKSN